MRPVRTAGSNFVYRGPAPGIMDAWVRRERAEGSVYLVWELDDAERVAIAGGASLRLGIHGMEPIPPTSLEVSHEHELTPEATALRDRALRALVAEQAEDTPERPGWWLASDDVWLALQRSGALDPDSGGPPTLLGRVLMAGMPGRNVLEFSVGREARA